MILPNKVRPGQPIRARDWNDLADKVLAAGNLTSDGTIRITRGPHGTHLALAGKMDGVLIKNDYSSELPAYGLAYVKGIDVSSYGATLPVVVVDRVGTTFKRDYLVNSAIPIASGQFGFAQRGPIVTVAYDSGTPAVGEVFGPLESTFTAKKGQPALLTCLGDVDNTNKWMLARLSEINTLLVKTTGAIAAGTDDGGTPATVSSNFAIHKETSGASIFGGTLPTCYNYGPAIVTSQWCVLTWINNQWVITPLQCGT